MLSRVQLEEKTITGPGVGPGGEAEDEGVGAEGEVEAGVGRAPEGPGLGVRNEGHTR
jgi:hypothetical protein